MTAIITTNAKGSAAIINNSYQIQAVRDLAWACFSPPMLHISQMVDKASGVSACTPKLSHDKALWLAQLDREPASLLEYLSARPTHRLGIYFEQLWHFFLQQDPDTELIAHNLAVHEAGRTLGEFDCIYYSKQRNCHVHLELAVKYFLGLPRSDDTGNSAQKLVWLGPDRRDSLEHKLEHLLKRQIRLGDTPAARRKLAELKIHTVSREIALKGYLFQPMNAAPPPPTAYNLACVMNLWLTCEQLGSHCAALDASAFVILTKMAWMSALQHPALDRKYNRQELNVRVLARLAEDPHPLLIAALDHNGLEASRFFVTPPGWPDTCNP